MILGIGIDMTEIDRIGKALEHLGLRFAERVLTMEELQWMPQDPQRVAYVAARFAAKEAALKALGTGMSEGISMRDVVVVREPGQAPTLTFKGLAAKRAVEMGVTSTRVSLTHSRGMASAIVVLEGKQQGIQDA